MTSQALISDISRIKYETERYLLGGEFDLCEERRFIARVGAQCCAVEISYNKLILSCWGEGWSRSWRVIGCEPGGERLLLHCTKQMGAITRVIELRRGGLTSEAAEARAQFFAKITALIEANLSGIKAESAVKHRDDNRHLSGVYTRLLLRERGEIMAGIAASESESQAHIDAILSSGLVWLEVLRGRGHHVNRLAIFLPRGRAFTVVCRLVYVETEAVNIAVYEVDEEGKRISHLRPFDQADLTDNLRRASRRAEWQEEKNHAPEVREVLSRVKRLAPGAIDEQTRGGWVYLSIRGLTFARLSCRQARLEFGFQSPRVKLSEENRSEFEALLSRINTQRRADSLNRNDEIFRLQPERWLETIICKDVTAIDPMLDARFAYNQVPAYRGEERTFIDLLTVTRTGRLVVMELKVSEDSEFPFQGLDYWIRVNWHKLRGDFERRGYFKGLQLSDEVPLLYLVAPLFRFHATTKLISEMISSKVPVYRIGINEDWRSGVRVLLHERVNSAGDK